MSQVQIRFMLLKKNLETSTLHYASYLYIYGLPWDQLVIQWLLWKCVVLHTPSTLFIFMQVPKSASFKWPALSSNMLSGFTSLRQKRKHTHRLFSTFQAGTLTSRNNERLVGCMNETCEWSPWSGCSPVPAQPQQCRNEPTSQARRSCSSGWPGLLLAYTPSPCRGSGRPGMHKTAGRQKEKNYFILMNTATCFKKV